MKKTLLTLSQLFLTIGLFGQTQLGTNLIGENLSDQSGWSTDISSNGNVVVVGAPSAVSDINGGIFIRGGHVRTYGYNGAVWTAGADFDAVDGGDSFGTAVAVNGNASIIACGAPNGGTSSVGYIHVYIAQGDPDTPVGYIRYDGNELVGDPGTFNFGRSIDLNEAGTRLIVGGRNYVKVFEKTSLGDPWGQIGQTLQGESSTDNFGTDVAINFSGNRIVVGNPASDLHSNNAGYARVYDLVGNTWTQVGNDITEGNGDNAGAGVDIASNGNRIAVSFPGDDNTNGNNAGAVRTYDLMGTTWTQAGTDIRGNANGDGLGSSGNYGAIDLVRSGSIIVVGSRSGVGNLNGYAEMYHMPIGGNVWSKIGNTITGTNSSDFFGYSVAINDADGTRVAIGAPQADDNGSLSGHTRVYDFSSVLSTEDASKNFSSLTLYPNPTTDLIYLKGVIPKEISIYDAQGRFVKKYEQPTAYISLGSFAKGMYFLQITDQSNAKSNKKVIIK